MDDNIPGDFPWDDCRLLYSSPDGFAMKFLRGKSSQDYQFLVRSAYTDARVIMTEWTRMYEERIAAKSGIACGISDLPFLQSKSMDGVGLLEKFFDQRESLKASKVETVDVDAPDLSWVDFAELLSDALRELKPLVQQKLSVTDQPKPARKGRKRKSEIPVAPIYEHSTRKRKPRFSHEDFEYDLPGSSTMTVDEPRDAVAAAEPSLPSNPIGSSTSNDFVGANGGYGLLGNTLPAARPYFVIPRNLSGLHNACAGVFFTPDNMAHVTAVMTHAYPFAQTGTEFEMQRIAAAQGVHLTMNENGLSVKGPVKREFVAPASIYPNNPALTLGKMRPNASQGSLVEGHTANDLSGPAGGVFAAVNRRQKKNKKLFRLMLLKQMSMEDVAAMMSAQKAKMSAADTDNMSVPSVEENASELPNPAHSSLAAAATNERDDIDESKLAKKNKITAPSTVAALSGVNMPYILPPQAMVSCRGTKNSLAQALPWVAVEVSDPLSVKGVVALAPSRFRVQLNAFQNERRKFSRNCSDLHEALWIFEVTLMVSDCPTSLDMQLRVGNFFSMRHLGRRFHIFSNSLEYYAELGRQIAQFNAKMEVFPPHLMSTAVQNFDNLKTAYLMSDAELDAHNQWLSDFSPETAVRWAPLYQAMRNNLSLSDLGLTCLSVFQDQESGLMGASPRLAMQLLDAAAMSRLDEDGGGGGEGDDDEDEEGNVFNANAAHHKLDVLPRSSQVNLSALATSAVDGGASTSASGISATELALAGPYLPGGQLPSAAPARKRRPNNVNHQRSSTSAGENTLVTALGAAANSSSVMKTDANMAAEVLLQDIEARENEEEDDGTSSVDAASAAAAASTSAMNTGLPSANPSQNRMSSALKTTVSAGGSNGNGGGGIISLLPTSLLSSQSRNNATNNFNIPRASLPESVLSIFSKIPPNAQSSSTTTTSNSVATSGSKGGKVKGPHAPSAASSSASVDVAATVPAKRKYVRKAVSGTTNATVSTTAAQIPQLEGSSKINQSSAVPTATESHTGEGSTEMRRATPFVTYTEAPRSSIASTPSIQ